MVILVCVNAGKDDHSRSLPVNSWKLCVHLEYRSFCSDIESFKREHLSKICFSILRKIEDCAEAAQPLFCIRHVRWVWPKAYKCETFEA